jgi:hypothetical protein
MLGVLPNEVAHQPTGHGRQNGHGPFLFFFGGVRIQDGSNADGRDGEHYTKGGQKKEQVLGKSNRSIPRIFIWIEAYFVLMSIRDFVQINLTHRPTISVLS